MAAFDGATLIVRRSGTSRQPTLGAVAPYFRWKGWVDRVLAGLLLLPGLPLIACLIVLVRWTSPGPGMFAQVRVGADRRRFTMYKIRTMRVDAEAVTGVVWSPVNDPRITPLGNYLRKFHLDELPQLINVLRGEMSLVGPRPERPEFVEVLAAAIPDYRQRQAVAPGITGLAQVNLPPDTDLDSVRRKLCLDLEYINAASLSLDLRLLAGTLLRLLGVRSKRALRLLRVERSARLPADAEEAPLARRITAVEAAVGGSGPNAEPLGLGDASLDLGNPLAVYFAVRRQRSASRHYRPQRLGGDLAEVTQVEEA